MTGIKSHFFFLSVALILGLATILKAQDPRDLDFDHITKEQGLSQSTGHAIYQGSEGYMWFGTNDGLNRYNGYGMDVFRHSPTDSTTISGSNISCIYEDRRNNLWVGTRGAGLNLFNRDTKTFTHYQATEGTEGQHISSNLVTSIIEDSGGKLWIGTQNGLNYYDRDNEKFYYFFADSSESGSLSSSYITSLYEDNQGILWIGTSQGLNRWNSDAETFTSWQEDADTPASISDNEVLSIYEDKRGNLWVGTRDGLNRFDRETGEFTVYRHDENDPNSISGNVILSMTEDSRGFFWVGTESNGLNAFDRAAEKFYRYTQDLDDDNSLTNNEIKTLYEDNNQNLWVGTYAGGINYLNRKKIDFEYYKYDRHRQNSLSHNSITSFVEDSSGNMWVGTDGGGLNIFNRETKEFRTIKHDPGDSNSLTSNVVLALHVDAQKNIWIGYYNGGISRYNPGTGDFLHYRYSENSTEGICHDDVFSIIGDKDNNIWIGTNGGGMCRLDPTTGQFTTYADGQYIRDLMIDSRENFWIASYGGGLKLLDRESNNVQSFYKGDSGLMSNIVLVLHEDQKNNFWVGTKEAGLHLFDRDSLSFHSYVREDGTPSNDVKGLLEDNDGNLWVSTNNGISKFNTQTESFRNYNVEDGVEVLEFNTLASYKDSGGYMYFGGINGFNRFHPDSLGTTTYNYPVVFTDFKIYNNSVKIGRDSPLSKDINRTDKIELQPYGSSVLTFEYAALNFNAIKNVNYAYKLEGFEDEWNIVENKRSATYTNLDPGEYTFKVKTLNKDQQFDEGEGTELALVIAPPFWKTYPFFVLFGTLGFVFLMGIYQWKVLNVRKKNEDLEKKVEERTSELYDKNEDLEKTMKELKDTRGELVEKAHKAGMADVATGVLHNVGNILNSISTSTSVIDDTLKNSRLEKLKQANEMLREHINNDIADFIANNPKGKVLLEYYLKVEEPLEKEYNRIKTQKDRLQEKVNLIIEVIAAQQDFSKADVVTEEVNIREVLENAITLQSGSIERHGLVIEREYENVEPVKIEKTKVMHILFNLLKNAKESMKAANADPKVLTVGCSEDEEYVHLTISDNGLGIKEEDLDKIFTHGFTTKEKGHGFGLHSCANYMKEMNGSIKAESKGLGEGATFTLSFSKKGFKLTSSSRSDNGSDGNSLKELDEKIEEMDSAE